MSIEWIDILLIVGIIQGGFLIVSLRKIKGRNVAANRTLSFFLGLALVMLIGRFLFARDLGKWVIQTSLFIDGVIFLFGPIYFLYIKRMTTQQPESIKLSFIHFLPFFLQEVFAIYCASAYSTSAYIKLLRSGFWTPHFNVIVVLAVLSNLAYLFFSLRHLIQYRRRAHQELSYKQSLVHYLGYYLSAILFCIVLWVGSFVNGLFFGYDLPFINYGTVWTTISAFTYFIGYFSLVMPDLFRFSKPIVVEESINYDRLSKLDVDNITEQIEQVFKTEKIYRDPSLSLQDVANAVSLKVNDLSWLLNNELKQSFYDYINSYRVEDFLERVQNGEHKIQTLLALSYESGFNAKSTFNKAFKKIMNVTPSAYIRTTQ